MFQLLAWSILFELLPFFSANVRVIRLEFDVSHIVEYLQCTENSLDSNTASKEMEELFHEQEKDNRVGHRRGQKRTASTHFNIVVILLLHPPSKSHN